MSFQTKCSKCGFEFEAEEEWIGQEAECPECETTFVIEKFKQETKINLQKTHSQNSIQPSTPPKESNKKFILKYIFIPSATAIFILLALVFLPKSETVKEKTTASPNGKNIGKQGEWNTFTVHYKEEEPKKFDLSCIVKEAYFKKEDDNYILTIKWMGENVDKVPSSMTWKSKFLMDKANRVFAPFNGTEVFDVQPLAKSDELIVRYKIPAVVELSDLNWGMYKENEFKYKILLKLEDFKNTIDYAKEQKEQEQIAEKKRQEAMVVYGKVGLSLQDGRQIIPHTQILLVLSNSKTGGYIESLSREISKYNLSKAMEEKYRVDMEVAGSNLDNRAIGIASRKAMDELTKSHNLWKSIVAKEGYILRQESLIKANNNGDFQYINVENGSYILIAKANYNTQDIYWIIKVNKTKEPVSLRLDNENAQIISK